jgi:outer membrane receptor for ferrienterochelin and colicins
MALGYRSEAITVDWTLFDSRVEGLITTQREPRQAGDPTPPATGSRNRYVNLNQAHIRGSELNLAGQIAQGWRWSAGWDALEAKDGVTGVRLQYTTRHTLRGGVTWTQGPWRADLRGRYLLGYYASPAAVGGVTPPREYSNFGVADVKLAYQVNRAWTVAAGIDNLFDRQQPRNYGIFNAIQDPAERFVYFQTQYRF